MSYLRAGKEYDRLVARFFSFLQVDNADQGSIGKTAEYILAGVSICLLVRVTLTVLFGRSLTTSSENLMILLVPNVARVSGISSQEQQMFTASSISRSRIILFWPKRRDTITFIFTNLKSCSLVRIPEGEMMVWMTKISPSPNGLQELVLMNSAPIFCSHPRWRDQI
jgi:hypothetical protein